MRLIDADALKEKAWDANTRCGYVQVVDVGDIDDAPTIDPVKHGRWIKHKDGYYRCSECGSRGSAIKAHYCHHCGSRNYEMRGEGDE